MVKQTHQSIIELNGQRFNARTGQMIDGISAPIRVQRPSIDGVMPSPRMPRTTTASKQIHKAAQSSKTLMRHAVKKPSTITDHTTVAMDVVQHSYGQPTFDKFHSVSPERIHRAESIQQNTMVKRFGGELRETQPMLTMQQPAVQVHPKPQSLQSTSPIAPIIQPTKINSVNNKMLEEGLRTATSHEEMIAKKTKLHHRVGKKIGLSARKTSIAMAGLAIVAIGGFVFYQNIPNISVRYASSKAGVHASLPTYQPAGFAINSHVAYSPGSISVAYKANADNRAYTVTQKSTNWNSDALKEHLMSETGSIPQSYPDNGQTIYLHDNNQADWVNNGVWYSISGKSELNTDQLIKIATSL